jgi:hypothetical protein
MTETILETLDETQRLILMAALIEGLGPEIEIRANCGRVLQRALSWAGMWSPSIRNLWLGDDVQAPDDWEEWYNSLIHMIHHQPAEEALFEGGGNFGSPVDPAAYPLYTGCRLTPLGKRVAEGLLERYPQYRKHG